MLGSNVDFGALGGALHFAPTGTYEQTILPAWMRFCLRGCDSRARCVSLSKGTPPIETRRSPENHDNFIYTRENNIIIKIIIIIIETLNQRNSNN